ncbi:MAG: hypothetical protein ACE5MI_09015 [Acidimicrobiia bacterium]
MAAQLVALKWRLLRNGLRGDRQRRFGLPVMAVLLAAAGWWAASSFYERASALSPPAAEEYSLWVITIGWVAWVVMPVLFFPLDEPLDPIKLSLMPWSRSRIMAGLTASGLITITILVPLAVLAADVAAFATPASMVLTLAGGAVLLLLLIAGGQAFTTLVSLGLRYRRGRDLAFLLVAAMGLGIYALYQTVSSRVADLGLEGAVMAQPLSPWSYLVPPASAQRVITASAEGDILTAILSLASAVLWLGGLTWLWSRVINRLVTNPTGSSLSNRRASRRRTRLGVRSPTLAVVDKELRTYLRDPRMRMVWTGGAVFVGLLAASLLLGTAQLEVFYRIPWLTMAGPLVVLFIGLPITLNQIGWERDSASFLFALPVDARVVLAGKNQAAATALLVEGMVMSAALATISGGWHWLPLAIPVALTAIGCQLAVGNVVSVMAPLRLPPVGSDLFAQATEQGCLSVISQAFAFLVIGLLLVPVAAAFIVVVWGFADPVLVSLGAVLWGGLFYWIGLRVSAILMARRVPELVAAVETHS